jgi:hypothetical protein
LTFTSPQTFEAACSGRLKKVKIIVTLEQATKTQWESRGIALLLLEALQLQRNFGLLHEFFPCGSVSDAVLFTLILIT